jgi:drug/metabolite transporter (DMT)-like permease
MEINVSGKALMTITCFIWALNTTLTKIGLEGFSSYNFLFYRFLLGAVLLTIIFKGRLKNIKKSTFISGVLLSMALFVGNAALTVSLDYLSAAEVNTYTALQIPMIPILAFLFIREKLTTKSVLCAILAALGTAVFNYTGSEMNMNIGVYIAILAAAGYAMHIVFTEKFVQDQDGVLLIIIQSYFIALYSGVLSFYSEGGLNFTADTKSIVALIVTGILANAISYVLQTLAQKKITASETGIIIALMPVFGLIIAMVLLGDRLTYFGGIGTGMILLSVFISNIDFKFKKNKVSEVNQ